MLIYNIWYNIFEYNGAKEGDVLKLILIGATSICAVTDLRERRIPNIITYPLLLFSLFYNIYINNIKAALLGFLLAFLIGFLGFFIGHLGAGDVKLMTAIGLSLGARVMIDVILLASILGIIYAILLNLYKLIKQESLKEKCVSFYKKLLTFNVLGGSYIKEFLFRKDKTHIPFGFFLAIALIIIYL